MRIVRVPSDAAAVHAALRAMLDGAGPALALGDAPVPADVPDGTAAVVATSGSSGIPKQVLLSRDALVASARATAARIGEGTWLLALPAGYVAGLQVLTRSILASAAPVLLNPSFRPAAFVQAAVAMREGGYVSLVPAQLHRLLDAADDDRDVAAALRRFRAILIGGQALPAPILERAHVAGARIVRTYGATETCGGCVYDGTPLPGVGVRITYGEVQLSGAMLADGYLGDQARTASAFPLDPDGTRWYRTGDAGALAGGVLRIHGRIDNVIISGGVNVSLDRVEHVVREVAGLADAVVVGVADERWGEASVIVTTAPAASSLLAAARTAVAATLGAPARPARIAHVDALPRLASGKPDRARIRELVR